MRIRQGGYVLFTVTVISCLILFLTAAAVRLMLAAPPSFQAGGDGAEYLELARHLAGDGAYVYDDGRPTAFRAPLYPALIACVIRLFGENPRALGAVQVALGSLGPPLLLLFLLQGGVEPARAFRGATLAIPLSVFLPGAILTENLYAPLLLCSTLLAVAAGKRERLRWSVAAGLATGATALARPLGLLLLPAFHAGYRDRKKTAVLALAAALTVLPWSIRNTLALGRPVFIDANAGYNLYMGNNPLLEDPPDFSRAFLDHTLTIAPDPLHDDRPLVRAALRYIALHPFRFVTRAGRKIIRLYGPGWTDWPAAPGGPLSAPLPFALELLPLLVTLGLLIRLPSVDFRDNTTKMTLAFITLVTFAHALFFGIPRYRDPLLPLMLTIALTAGRRPPAVNSSI